MIKCVVFDVFGTLYHYDRKIFTRDFSKTYSVLQTHIPSLEFSEFGELWKKVFVNKLTNAKKVLNEFSLLSHALSFLEIVKPDCRDKYILARNLSDQFIEEWLEQVKINPFAKQFLAEVYATNILIAVSNVNDTKILSELFVRDKINKYFSLVLTSAGFGKRKPSTLLLDYAIDFLNIKNLPIIIVGDDSIEDQELGKKLNARYYQFSLPTNINPDEKMIYDILKKYLLKMEQ